MEACVYSMMCKNRDVLWRLEAGDDWHCETDRDGFLELRDYLVSAR